MKPNFKQFFLVLLLFFLPTSATEPIEEAFVTFATPSYFGLLEVLLDSIHHFSTRPIVAYGINSDIPFDCAKYPRLIKRRLNISNTNRPYIFYQKPNIIAISNIKYGIYVEADDIVNVGVDNLFQECRKIEMLPLCPIHHKDPNDQGVLMRTLGVACKSMPYVHAHVLFSHKCIPFINEWYQTCVSYGYLAPCADETVLNVLFWKYGARQYLDVYDPLAEQVVDLILYGTPMLYYKHLTNIKFYMLHGQKVPQYAHNTLKIMKDYAHKNNLLDKAE